MRYSTAQKSFLLVGVGLVIALTQGLANGQVASTDFRIETDVFAEEYERPITSTVTRFADGVAYDESRDPNEDITIVDPSRGRILLLNEAQQLMTVLEIGKLKDTLQLAATQARAGRLAVFLAGASQVQSTDNEVKVGASPLVYRATLQSHSDASKAIEVAKRYREFADATKLLNSFSGRGDPPFARLALNEAIEQKQALPKEIDVTSTRGGKDAKFRCVVNANWLLSKLDRKRIKEISNMVSNFEEVSAADYSEQTQLPKVASPGPGHAMIPKGR